MKKNTPIKNANLELLKFVVAKLEELCDEFVFVGGSAAVFLITEPNAPDIRPTIDVDCIVDVVSLSQYYRIEERLRQKGFIQSVQDNVICRWHIKYAILDIMPVDEKILGFSNRWYKDAITAAVLVPITDQQSIKVISAPYFLATKLDAFDSRGKSDFLASHDLEDVIAVIDGRPEIVEEIFHSDAAVKAYLSNTFYELMDKRDFQDALPGHLNNHVINRSGREKIVWERIKKISALRGRI